jgi:hypothetical protein
MTVSSSSAGLLGDEHRVVPAVEAESEDSDRAMLKRDPWSETHLRVDTIEPWTIRLDGRRANRPASSPDADPELGRIGLLTLVQAVELGQIAQRRRRPE